MPEIRTLDELKAYVQTSGWQWHAGKYVQYGEQIIVSDGQSEVPVNYYPRRGKYSIGGADSALKTLIGTWLGLMPGGESMSVPVDESAQIGMDESGKGDWFGPLVVAAVYVDRETAQALMVAGVKDSKKLNDVQIQSLAQYIETIVTPAARVVTVLDPETYNTRYAQVKNINLLLADIYGQTAYEIWQHTSTPTIVCDQFSEKSERLDSAFQRYPGLPIPVQMHHAESQSIAVAAASILASAAFSQALAMLGEQAGLGGPLPRGASDLSKLTAAARQIIATHGSGRLAEFAKLNFQPVRALLSGEQRITQSAPVSLVDMNPGEQVTLKQRAWDVTQHPSGYWRFTFTDGGILDWYYASTGRFTVRGKTSAASYQILFEKAHGRTFIGDLEKVKQSVRGYVPEFSENSVGCVLGVGWRQQDTFFGTRFRFTDGAILLYYASTQRLLVQGRPNAHTKEAFESLSSYRHSSIHELAETLKLVFPDWQLGETMLSKDDEPTETWSPLDNSLEWRDFWPSTRDLRQAANPRLPCQHDFLKDWSSVLAYHAEKRHLLAHASTGLGKTIAALVPALAWVAKSPNERRIYYLVNRVTQHDNPLRELRDSLAASFEERTGQPLKVVDLVGRTQLCVSPNTRNRTEFCRLSEETAQFDFLPSNVASWQEVADHVKDQYCPYHLLRGLVSQAHVIICDYWWLFSVQAQQAKLMYRFGFSPRDSVVIVDEAHNLPLRIRSEVDIALPLDHLGEMLASAPDEVQNALHSFMNGAANLQPPTELKPQAIIDSIGGVEMVRELVATMTDDEQTDESPILRFLRILTLPIEDVIVFIAEEDNRRSLICKLVDPTSILREGFSRAFASLSMSGTLAAPTDDSTEMQYLVPLFGMSEEDTVTRKYASPFAPQNQRWIYTADTLGIRDKRDEYLTQYAQHIVTIGRSTPGITAVFFSSYEFLKKVYEAIVTQLPDEAARIVCEKADEPDDRRMLSDYESILRDLVGTGKYGYLFAIYQGKLSEGANFAGNLIRTVICISIPMEYPNFFHKRLQERYSAYFKSICDRQGTHLRDKAREYAFDRLSMSLVLQSCGRGIRQIDDRCVFVLLDGRYNNDQWRRFLTPKPYNLTRPAPHVYSFHHETVVSATNQWDEGLLNACQPLSNQKE